MINFTNEELETIINMAEKEVDSARMLQYGNDEIQHFGELREKASRMLFSRLATNDHKLWKKIYFLGDEFWVNGYNFEEIMSLRIRDSYQMRGLISTAIALKERGELLVLEVDDEKWLNDRVERHMEDGRGYWEGDDANEI